MVVESRIERFKKDEQRSKKVLIRTISRQKNEVLDLSSYSQNRELRTICSCVYNHGKTRYKWFNWVNLNL